MVLSGWTLTVNAHGKTNLLDTWNAPCRLVCPCTSPAFAPSAPWRSRRIPSGCFLPSSNLAYWRRKRFWSSLCGFSVKRNIFSDTLLDLIDTVEMEQDGRLNHEQGALFMQGDIHSFSWQPTAATTYDEYVILRTEHPIPADIACLNSAHINHLTPRALDVGIAQTAVIKGSLRTKDRIEGPPTRNCPILFRQTSFLALEERIRFLCAGSGHESKPVRYWS